MRRQIPHWLRFSRPNKKVSLADSIFFLFIFVHRLDQEVPRGALLCIHLDWDFLRLLQLRVDVSGGIKKFLSQYFFYFSFPCFLFLGFQFRIKFFFFCSFHSQFSGTPMSNSHRLSEAAVSGVNFVPWASTSGKGRASIAVTRCDR